MADMQVLVLMGGPDGERDVSIKSGQRVAAALREAGGFEVHEQVIDRPTLEDIRAMPGDAIFPVLHGPWGEGGGLQELLEVDGRPYVGSRPRASRAAMDKATSKLFARAAGIRTPPARVLHAGEPCDLPLPLVVKPVADGSSLEVHRCFDEEQLNAARARFDAAGQPALVERLVQGREITASILERDVLPLIEIETPQAFYDYAAKYERNDTQYRLDPELPDAVREEIVHAARTIYERLGCRDVARADFMVDADGAWFLEINSMPGMTDHSLVPKAAAHAGITFPQMCKRLVERAVVRLRSARRQGRPRRGSSTANGRESPPADAGGSVATETSDGAE
ncbi:MAG: D-alanine--D-alanine ligase [Phycisphaerae bacterium]|nr:D-alanine--D-alanine ligase [Phycisphaerae bacterium]